MYILGFNDLKQLTPLNQAIKENLKTYLNYYRMLTDAINIKDAFIINIGVNFEISVLSNYNSNETLLNCINELRIYFDIDRWQINQPVIKSEIVNLNVKINNLDETKERLLTNFENNVQERLTKEYEIIKSHVESEFIKKPPKYIENEFEIRNKRIQELEIKNNVIKEDFVNKINKLSNERDNIKIDYDNKIKEYKNELNTLKEKYDKGLNIFTKDYEDKISIHRRDNDQKLKEINR
jgi:hypothetical protein